LRRLSRALPALAAIPLLVAVLAAAQTRPSTIPVEEVRRGMVGYGLTVFEGETPARFDVEVIDVLHNFRPGQDIILVRTRHPILEHAATVAGMSGSPIYLDDRLAGAYAYGWPFGKDPIAGVTPIANMLAEMRRTRRPDAFPLAAPLARVGRATARFGASPDARLAGLPAHRGETPTDALSPLRALAQRRAAAQTWSAQPDARALRLEPAATPLMLGGFGDRAIAELSEQLAPFGLMPLQAGGSARTPAPGGTAPRYVDGGAIGVQLVRGDISATGVGTVTHVAGRELVAFGHPMMNAGETGLPTATARVLHILASEQRSFKLAEAVAPLGALVNDRQAAIVVDSGVTAATVPVTLRVHGPDGLPRDTWRFEVASHRVLTPAQLLSALANALEATVSDETDLIVEARSRIAIERRTEMIELSDRRYAPAGVASPRALGRLRLFEALEAVYGNPFEQARIRSVELDLTVQFGRELAHVVDAVLPDDEVDPGERVDLVLTLRAHGRPDEQRVIPVDIPRDAAGTELELAVQPGDEVPLENPEPRSLDDLLAIVGNRLPPTSLVVSMRLPSRGLRFEGHVARSLPPSALDALSLTNGGAPAAPFATQLRQIHPMGRLLGGGARLRVRVRPTPRAR
jgi:hypothetical protein